MKVKHFIHTPAIVCIALLLIVSLSLNLVPYLKKPRARAYTWTEGHSDDYIGYVSYIKEGMYGRNTVAIRSLPKEGQRATPVHFFYIGIGKIAGLLHVSAPLAYHFARVLLSIVYMVTIYKIFSGLFQSTWKATLLLLFAAVGTYVSFYRWNGSAFHYVLWNYHDFSSNLVLRLMSRPHYEFGAILFLIISMTLYLSEKRSLFTGLALVLLSILLATVHPSFAFILLASIFIMIVFDMFSHTMIKKNLPTALWSVVGLCIGLIVSNWSIRQYPFFSILAFEEYVYSTRVTIVPLLRDAISFGPMLWLGIPGIVLAFIQAQTHKRWKRFLLVWIVVQLSMYFFLYPILRAEKMRFIQSLYFIPLAYGAGYLLLYLEKKFRVRVFGIGMLLLIAVSISTYIHDFWSYLHISTDYTSFSTFLFPTRAMMDAYVFLDTHTPKESVVLAGFEASNTILLYSHNFVIGNSQGWTKGRGEAMVLQRDAFFSGGMTKDQKRAYLAENHIGYIYYGYQERQFQALARDSDLYTRIYQNSEVEIYKVN